MSEDFLTAARETEAPGEVPLLVILELRKQRLKNRVLSCPKLYIWRLRSAWAILCVLKPYDYSPSMWGKAQPTVTWHSSKADRGTGFTGVLLCAPMLIESRSALFLPCKAFPVSLIPGGSTGSQ